MPRNKPTDDPPPTEAQGATFDRLNPMLEAAHREMSVKRPRFSAAPMRVAAHG